MNRTPSFISSLVHIGQKTFKALILFLSLIRLLRIVITTVMSAYLKGMFGPEARPTVASRLPKTSSCSYMWSYGITIKWSITPYFFYFFTAFFFYMFSISITNLEPQYFGPSVRPSIIFVTTAAWFVFVCIFDLVMCTLRESNENIRKRMNGPNLVSFSSHFAVNAGRGGCDQ